MAVNMEALNKVVAVLQQVKGEMTPTKLANYIHEAGADIPAAMAVLKHNGPTLNSREAARDFLAMPINRRKEIIESANIVRATGVAREQKIAEAREKMSAKLKAETPKPKAKVKRVTAKRISKQKAKFPEVAKKVVAPGVAISTPKKKAIAAKAVKKTAKKAVKKTVKKGAAGIGIRSKAASKKYQERAFKRMMGRTGAKTVKKGRVPLSKMAAKEGVRRTGKALRTKTARAAAVGATTAKRTATLKGLIGRIAGNRGAKTAARDARALAAGPVAGMPPSRWAKIGKYVKKHPAKMGLLGAMIAEPMVRGAIRGEVVEAGERRRESDIMEFEQERTTPEQAFMQMLLPYLMQQQGASAGAGGGGQENEALMQMLMGGGQGVGAPEPGMMQPPVQQQMVSGDGYIGG